MKNRDLQNLKNVLEEISNSVEYRGIEFSYFILKNKKIVSAELATFEELLKDVDVEEYQKERNDILSTCSTDSNGEVKTKKIDENRIEYLIVEEKRSEYESLMKELAEKYKETLQNYEMKYNEYIELMNKDTVIEPNLFKISKSNLPNNISIKHFDAIFELVEM